MKSKLLKSVLLGILIVITVLSFRHGPRRRVALPRPSGQPAPGVVTQTQPRLPAAGLSEEWERYTYAGEEFSVEMPGMPFVYKSRRAVGSLDDAEPVRTFGLYSGGVVLIVTSFDNPHEEEKPEYFAAYHWAGISLAYARAVRAGLFAGKEFESAGAYFTRARVFYAQRHAYLVCALSMGPDDPRAARFLDSFALGGRPEGERIYEPPPPPADPAPAETPDTSGGPYKGDEVSRKAIVVFKPPGYRDKAEVDDITGTVRLKAVLSADGEVRDISVVKSPPRALKEEAVDAARHILFFPAVKDGRAVSQYVTLEYNFGLLGNL